MEWVSGSVNFNWKSQPFNLKVGKILLKWISGFGIINVNWKFHTFKPKEGKTPDGMGFWFWFC